jgi:hypothetical protein
MSFRRTQDPLCVTGADIALICEAMADAVKRAGLEDEPPPPSSIQGQPVTLTYVAARWKAIAAPDMSLVVVADLSVGGDLLFAVPTGDEERRLLAALCVDYGVRLLGDADDETIAGQEAWDRADAMFAVARRIEGRS